MNCYIAGTGSFLPENVINNEAIFSKSKNFDIARAKNSIKKKNQQVDKLTDAQVFDTWVRQVCGIKQRPFVSKEFVATHPFVLEEMAKKASEVALLDAGMHVDEIEHIVFSSYSSEYLMPGSAATLSNLLGLKNPSGVNINGACSGFLDALVDASAKIEAGFYDNILVVASEYMSNKLDFDDLTTCILFADGAGAVVLKKGKAGIHSFANQLKFNADAIQMKRTGCITMSGGPLVQKNAVIAMATVTEKAVETAGHKLSDYQYIIPHQANIRILNSLEEKLKLETTQMIKCIGKTGNLSSATIPVALDLLKKNKLDIEFKKNKKAIFTSIGGGYTYSAVTVTV